MCKMNDAWAALCFFAIGLAVIVEAIFLDVGTVTEPRAGFFPLLSGIALAVFSANLFLRVWRTRHSEAWQFGYVWGPVLMIAGSTLYTIIFNVAGYTLSTIFLSILVLRMLEIRSWRTTILVSIFVSLGSYILFDGILGVDMPAGLLPDISEVKRLWIF